MKEAEFKKAVVNDIFPVAHVVAMDGVCVIVHPSNPVKALTSEQVRKIYRALWAAGVDYMEIGYRHDKNMFPPAESGPWRYCDEELLRDVIEGVEPVEPC